MSTRRGFFGLMAGAAVAGPGMAKDAVASASSELAALNVGSISTAAVGYASGELAGSPEHPAVYATKAIAKLAGMTPDARGKLKRRMSVQALDPDIMSYKSIALQAKIDWQREREVDRRINDRKSYLQRVIDNVVGEDDPADYL